MQTAIPISAIIPDTVLKATVLLALASGAAFVLKKRSAATRHMVRTFALSALLLLPFSVMVLPELPVKGLPGFARSKTFSTHATSVAQSRTAAPSLPAAAPAGPFSSSPVEAAKSRVDQRSKLPSTEIYRIQAAPISPERPAASAAQAITPASPNTTSATSNAEPAQLPVQLQSSPKRWKRYLPQALLLIWVTGAIYFLIRWRWNALRLSGLVRRAAVLTDSGWNAQVRSLSGNLEINRHVALLVSDEIEIPITTGIMFPKVVLSPDFGDWSAQRRSAILNHELAHIRRLDAFTQALAQVAAAFYWFHPLVWLMVQAMRAERERACDDQVLASGTKASDYAHELARHCFRTARA